VASGPKLEYRVNARRIDSHGSEANTKSASITLDTDVAGRQDAFNPAELLLASLAACMIKGAERALPMLHFELSGIAVHLRGTRQDAPPRMTEINYEIIVDTNEDDHRLELLHTNIRKYGTISNTLAGAVKLEGTIKRATSPEKSAS
jgi:uncharacterized OsmC-like protein